MAIRKRSTPEQKPIPHEPGQWFAFVRLPAYELEERTKDGGDLSANGWETMSMRERFDLAHRWLTAVLVGWSYQEPLTDETRQQLDAPTLLWAYLAAAKHNFMAESLEEKKADSPASTPGSTATPAPSAPTPGS